MKRSIVYFIIYILLSIEVSAQSIINPVDSFYDDLQVWDAMGLVPALPPLRPYPEALVKSILKTVMEGDSSLQGEEARRHYERLFGKPLNLAAEGIGTAKVNEAEDRQEQVNVSAIAFGSLPVLNIFSISYDLNLLLSNKAPGEEIIPKNSGYAYDIYKDTADIGPFSVYAGFNTSAAANYKNVLWLQGGVSRSSWGDFYDNGVVIGPNAIHAGNISLVIHQQKWNYTLALFLLSASSDVPTNPYTRPYPEKFMSLHSIGYSPWDWLSLTVYENAVFGQRFEPLYLLPISPFMVSQELIGVSDDNIQMGLSFKIKPLKGLSWATNIFLDDAQFNDMVRFKFDTKIRTAVQSGITWAPSFPFISLVQLDYTLITPYTYTHEDDSDDGINYQNYTNNGRSLGAAIPPNSDRISLTGKFEPFKTLKVNTSAVFIRHANVNESLPWDVAAPYLYSANSVYSDGGILDSPNAGEGYFDYAHHHLMFMEQDTKQYITQLGLDLLWELPPLTFGTITFSLGYMFEYIYNDGVDRNMFTGYELAVPPPGGHTQAVIQQKISDAKSEWKNNLSNRLNHYLTLGMRLLF
ncbi:hypothetical protein LQZ21_06085 [Treponema sp. TIM-1]|uniref:hypothetical protein n=1 Tax=Treponema sp. TIM-1 TaxID=2898417 RepID=UPI00398134AF